MFCNTFIERFEEQYPDIKWSSIEDKIYSMFNEVFLGATSEEHPAGIAYNPQSKAAYGFDVMLDWVEDENGINVQSIIYFLL